jgi:uncharacterized protein
MTDGRGLTIEVAVVYALEHEQIVLSLAVPLGATIEQALELSGIFKRYPDASSAAVGIFGRRTDASTVLRQFDRIEIYRALIADPKQARRARARRKPASPV